MNISTVSSLQQIPSAMYVLASAVIFLLLGLLVWAVCRVRSSDAGAAAAKQALSTQKDQRDALRLEIAAQLAEIAAQQDEMEGNAQSMNAANSLLMQASGRFQELFQGLPTACVCFDKNGRIMEWNRAFEQLYALPAVLDTSVWETIYSGECRPEIENAVAAVFEGKRREGIERTFRRPDGSEVHLYGSIFPLRGGGGEITGAISTDIDISAQKQAEEALRRNEERLHTLYNITSQHELSFEEKTQALLSLGADQFGLALGILARVQNERYQIVQAISPGNFLAAGTEFAVCDTYCAEALKLADAVGIEEVGATALRESATYRDYGLEAYLGAPVWVSGAVWGTLCFAGYRPHPRLSTDGDRELLRLMAQWIGGEIARREAELAVKDSEERFRIATGAISEGLIVLDASGIVTLWNESAERILGMTDTKVHGLRPVNPEFAAVREDGTKFPQGSYPLMASLRRGVAQQNVVMGLPRQSGPGGLPGEMLWVSVNAKPLFQTGALRPHAVVATFADISERRHSAEQIARQMVQITEYAAVLEQQKGQLEDANRQLETLALHDSLTGLGNRRAFEKRLVQEMNQVRRYGTPLSLLLLDVDSFKAYNDTFGHPAGDEILRRLAKVIQDQGRETDFFARYGGEEFVVVLPLTDGGGATVLAERLRAVVQNAKWPERPVTISIGAATLLDEMPGEDALVSAADQALYAAKSSGRNCVRHADSLPEASVSKALLLLAA